MIKTFSVTLTDAQVKALGRDIVDPDFFVTSNVEGIIGTIRQRADAACAAIVAEELLRLRQAGLPVPDDEDQIVMGAPIKSAAERAAEYQAELQQQAETAASLRPLTARQLRLGLVGNGIGLDEVAATIDAMPDGPDKDRALIEWQFATSFERDHPLIASVAAALGLTDEQVDMMWRAAHAL